MSFIRYSNRASGGRRVPGSNDRRRVVRYPVIFCDALLGWWEGSSFLQVPARLLDLSLQGCLLELKRVPARTARQSAWVRSLAASSEEWTEGVVISVRKPFLKRCRVRFAFRSSFPYQSFKKLVYGTEELDGKIQGIQDEAPPHERDHYWK